MTIPVDTDTYRDVTIGTTTNKCQRQSVCALCEDLYDKRDYFTFQVNFPFISGNIPASTAYGVYISQPIKVKDPLSFEIWIVRTCQLNRDDDCGIFVAMIST
jgi:hypothetical protein